MKLLWPLFITASFFLQSTAGNRPIRLETLNLNQTVRIEWRVPGEYALVQHYELSFHVAADAQLVVKNLLQPESAENRCVRMRLSKEELREIDKALDLYREQRVVFCGEVPVHHLTISLFEGDLLVTKESFNNRCLHSKLSELIDGLERQAASNSTDR